jgi:hypothetical protein
LVRFGCALKGLDTEGDVPAQGVLDQSCPGDPVDGARALADWEVFGPAEPDPADFGNVDHAPTAVHPDDVQVRALRDVHRHHRTEAGLEVRLVRPAVPAVLPRLEVRLQYRLRGLGGQGAEPVDLFAGLADRRVRRSERPPLPREHRPPVVQQIPQGAGGVGLVVHLWPGVTPVI